MNLFNTRPCTCLNHQTASGHWVAVAVEARSMNPAVASKS